MTSTNNVPVIDIDTVPYVKELGKTLEQVEYGWTGWRVFDDFLDASIATLLDMGDHFKNIAATGSPLKSTTSEHDALFVELHEKYDAHGMSQMAKGLGILMSAAAEGYGDVIGDTYESTRLSNKWAGQYFTPMPVCMMMAQMQEPSKGVYQRIKEALLHEDNILGHAVVLTSSLFASGDSEFSNPELAGDYFLEHALPAALPFYQPIKAMDPACGSGRLLLALAASCEPWMVAGGFISFWGQDIDKTCVNMAKLNCLLYGMNGTHAKILEAIATPVISPEPLEIQPIQAIPANLVQLTLI